jgi:glycine/D-amino acid oxidase-like deaminating enzyme
MKLTSYWLDTAPAGPDRSRTEIGGHVDVAVVGGGLTGMSAALHLARKGARVAVLEKETVGWGASGRNGGMATPGLSLGIRDAVAKYGLPTARHLYNSYYDAIDTIEKLVTDEGIDCDFSRPGKLNLAAKPSHFEGMRRTHELLTERLGVKATLVPGGGIRSEIASDAYHGALIDPLGAGLHVGKFVRGLGESAARAGAQIHEKADVTAVNRLGGGTRHELVTSRGRIRAEQVLVATSGYTGSPFRWLQVRIAPVGSFIIVTEPLGKDLCEQLLPRRRMVSDSKNLLYYFRCTPDHRLLFGGRARFAKAGPSSDQKSGRILRDAMVSVFPQLAKARVDYCWGGLVDMSMDRLVHAGEQDGLFYSVGYSGHGVQMATHMGMKMADYMDGDVEANPWGDVPFRRIPGHFGPPWFLPFAGAYYKFKDRVS